MPAQGHREGGEPACLVTAVVEGDEVREGGALVAIDDGGEGARGLEGLEGSRRRGGAEAAAGSGTDNGTSRVPRVPKLCELNDAEEGNTDIEGR
ncbi:hypothetical protein, partial [Streptomyces scabiei]|uniref:hypothetical protein n=1 Tax=Streptomyces scabiei TaxID=1930 RepID=UPI0029AF4F30